MENGVQFESSRLLRTISVASFIGASVLSSCTTDLPPPTPEAIPLGSITVCYDDDPSCSKPIAVISEGNSTPVVTIPEVCINNVMVTEDLSTEVDPDVLWALFSTEDQDFCDAYGPNIMSLLKAAVSTITGNPRGGSGIKEQLARIFYIEDVPDSLISRKFWESFEISPTLDNTFARTDIVKIYLNTMYWGEDAQGVAVYGIYEASMMYFGKPPNNLEIEEAAFLIGALQNPNKYSPKADPQADQTALRLGIERRNEVLQNHVDDFGRLTQTQADELKKIGMARVPYTSTNIKVSDFSEADRVNARAAIDEIIGQVMAASEMTREELMTSNVVIHSTLVKEDMEALHNAMISTPKPEDGRQYGGMFIDDTGGVTSYIPGLYQENGPNINLLEARVNGGSTDKIRVTMELLERGYTKDSAMPDPDRVDWLNYDGNGRNFSVTETSHCPNRICTLEEAFIDSVNVSFVAEVKKLEESGDPILSDTLEGMEQLGMDPGGLVGPSLVLGGQAMSPEARAMGLHKSVARQGQDSSMRFVNSFTLDNGQVSEYIAPTFFQIEPAYLTAQLTEIMSGVVINGTAANASAEIATLTQIANKTGTMPDNRAALDLAVACDKYGRNKTGIVIERQPGNLAPLGRDTDGGNRPARVLAKAMAPLIGEWCSITDANQTRITRGD